MLGRRTLLTTGAAATLLLASGKVARASAGPRFADDPFALGIASGDPRQDGVVLWTRLLPQGDDPGTPRNRSFEVQWDLADDERFQRVVRSGRVTARAANAHAVHVELYGLDPARSYFYRFRCGNAESRTGRTRTAPATNRRLDRARLAVACCQHFEQGFFHAYRDLREAMPDALFFVGDYIYEHGFGTGPTPRRFDTEEPRDLAGYRRRYAQYRRDEDLLAAHAELPWFLLWDDHEVSNDYAGTQSAGQDDPAAFRARRTAAYRAYVEHMPVRPSARQRDGWRLYGQHRWGDLLEIDLLDTRQYRDAQPCPGDKWRGGAVVRNCTEADAPQRSILGAAQEAWSAKVLGTQQTRWATVVQQSFFAPLDLGEGARWSDIWDGYGASRRRMLDAFAGRGVAAPVILGGDVHSSWASEVDGRAVEFIATCLASRNADLSKYGFDPARNPHVRFSDCSRNGWLDVTVTRDQWRTDFRSVRAPDDPAAGGETIASFGLERDRPSLARL